MNIFHLLDQAARRFPGLPALYRGTDPHFAYAQLHRHTLAIAAHLSGRYPPGTRAAIISENCPEYVEFLFGCWAAGLAAVPVNAKLHPIEMIQILEDSGAGIVFVSPRLATALVEAARAAPALASCGFVVIGAPPWQAMIAGSPGVAASVAPESLAWLFYTSGTTGRSKGAMLSHRNLLAMTVAHLADVETIDESASQIHAAPMSHGSGLYILAYVSRGARLVIPASSGFDPKEFLDLCDFHPGCGAFLAPTMVQRLRVEAERTARRPRHLRAIVYGGGPMYVGELKKSLAAFGQVLVQVYGQGESPMTITCLRRADHASGDDAILGSVGWARTGVEVAVVDGEGRPVPEGEPGEVVCRGDVVMAGYWNNPKATQETLREGWLHTGDIGTLDAHGYLTLRDRSKDLIISGGANIYPREVEEALLTHPGVSEASVVGQRDPEWGEVVVAFVVRGPGTSASEGDLDAHCLARIARFKRPKHYRFVDSLPKNNYGKVLKRELRAQLDGPLPD